VLQAEGPNDGVVSISSATYGESTEVWDGHHLSLVNWQEHVLHGNGNGQDRAPKYAALVARLADEGY
jgi:triacylglycerol lipase